jgi:hypothetical protein
MADREKSEVQALFQNLVNPKDRFTPGELKHLPRQNLELFRKTSFANKKAGGAGFYDEDGNFDLFGAYQEALAGSGPEARIYQRERMGQTGKASAIYDSTLTLTDAGQEFIGEDSASIAAFDRNRAQQASTAVSSLSSSGGRAGGSSADAGFSLTAEPSRVIRKETQLGLGGSGKGKIILG